MANALAVPVELGPKIETLSTELLQVLTAGNAARLEELLSPGGQANSQVAINVQATAPVAVAPPGLGAESCLLGVTSSGNTALHLVASRGYAVLAAVICERAPSLVATLNRSLDTPLHCAARGGHRAVAACILTRMRAGGADEAEALRARNQHGATALHEAVRHHRANVVDLFMDEAPELASVTSDEGVSPLYLAATPKSEEMVRSLLQPLPDGRPSPASSAGRNGRTALHVAATVSKEMVEDIVAWEPEGPALLTKVDSSGRSPLHFAIGYCNLDIFELLLDANSHVARISDNNGLFPLHLAANVRSTRMIDDLIKRCPDYSEMVDDKGRTLLHFAVMIGSNTIVQYICQNERFTALLNVTDWEGNTPLHLAAKYSHARIVSTLLQVASVEININNKDGLTARDLAYIAGSTSPSRYFMDPAMVVFNGLHDARAASSLDRIDMDKKEVDENTGVEPTELEEGGMRGTISSGLIATVTFAAALTVPGGFIADDHPHYGTAILARRFAFRAFAVSDTMAFVCSIVATCFLMYGSAREVPLSHRRFWYNRPATGLVPLAVQFTIGAFAFGFHLVLGAANHGLMIFVYLVSSAAVLFCFPGIWAPFFLGYEKAIWRRAGWKGLLDLDESEPFHRQLLTIFSDSTLVNVRRILFAVLICATFVVAIALEIALPNY